MQVKILTAQKKTGKPFTLRVTGYSMNPTLYEADSVTFISSNTYEIGDILVFCYDQEELLLHRLIDRDNDVYYCKGDNALRVEKISHIQIIGKVIELKRNEQIIPIPQCTNKLLVLSKAVNRAFLKCRYDPVKTRATYIYKLYERIIIKREDIMAYLKNEKLDYIDSDENSTAVFDPDSGDTHFLDEAGTDIIKILEQPHDVEAIISQLCELYDAEAEKIQAGVKDFLNDAVAKGIVIEL